MGSINIRLNGNGGHIYQEVYCEDIVCSVWRHTAQRRMSCEHA
jgi:hypothetical protein